MSLLTQIMKSLMNLLKVKMNILIMIHLKINLLLSKKRKEEDLLRINRNLKLKQKGNQKQVIYLHLREVVEDLLKRVVLKYMNSLMALNLVRGTIAVKVVSKLKLLNSKIR